MYASDFLITGIFYTLNLITHTDRDTAAPCHAHTANCRAVVPQNSISSASAHRTERSYLQASSHHQALSTINTIVLLPLLQSAA